MIGRLLLMLVLAAVIVPQVKGQQSRKKDPCENAQNQQEMNHCAEDEFHKADQKLNKLYNNLGSKLEPERLAKLKEAERAWVKFRDADCDFVTYINKGGSIYPLVYFGCLTESTNDRIKQLEQMLKEENPK
jgi:uncharacterized protein YecT (DUF1311 family)